MSIKQIRRINGVTLIEIMVAMVVTLVAIIGAIGYRYYSILDARKAKVQITAARLGSVLLENWKGAGAHSEPDNDFDPQDLAYGESGMYTIIVSPSNTGPPVPDELSGFGAYAIIIDGVTYYVTLSYQDDALSKVRVLNTCVAWPYDYPSGAYSITDQSIKLTTKAKLPAS